MSEKPTITVSRGFVGPDGETLKVGDTLTISGTQRRSLWYRIRSVLRYGYWPPRSHDGAYRITAQTTAERIEDE